MLLFGLREGHPIYLTKPAAVINHRTGSGVTRNSGANGQNIQWAPLLSFPYLSPPIPFQGLPTEIFMLVHELYCTLNIKFSTVMQWILWVSGHFWTQIRAVA